MMKHKHLSLVLMALAMVFATTAQAQIKGTVFEESTGEPVIGASILQVGTTNGVITDFDGNFELNVPEGTELQFSYMGFQAQTLPAKNGMTVRLKEDAIEIQEVVAIGYGSQKKKEVTGSVASVKAEDFNAGVQTSPAGLLQGKVAGLNISRSTADPTSTGYDIQIRGFSTLDKGAGTSPLFIVDGVPVSSIDQIAPSDIASMDVLKDGSAAAIYGTRGTNGVIIITTKRGSGFSDESKTQLEYDGYASIAWNRTKSGMATADEYRQVAAYTNGAIRATDLGANENFMKLLVRPVAVTHSHSLSATGSHKNFTYRASVSFKDAQGIAKENARREIMAKFAADHKALNGWLQLQYDASYMHYRNDFQPEATDNFNMASVLNPTTPLYNEDGSLYTAFTTNGNYNVLEALKLKEAYTDGNFFRGSIKTTVNIKPVPGLKVNAFAALEEGDNHTYWAHGDLKSDALKSGAGQAGREMNTSLNQLYEATIDYANGWNGHNLVVVGGFSYQHFYFDKEWITNDGFAMSGIKYNSIGEGDPEYTNLSLGSERTSSALAAAFLRVNYNYNEKYLLSASIRAEGSSKFGKGNKWGYFPSVSLGWRIKAEDFMKSADWCQEMKLRLGFGMTGNDLKSPYRSLALLAATDPVVMDGKKVLAYNVYQNVNDSLKWEKKMELNLGFDFSFLKDRLSGSLDAYFRQTNDLLWDYVVPMPPYQYETLLANAGQMRSYGVELALTGVPVKRGNWTWTSTLTMAWNDNIITKLSDPAKGFNYTESLAGYVGGNCFNSMYTQILIEGQSVGSFYGYKFAGIDEDGVWYYYNHNNKPTPASQVTEDDRRVVGNAQPILTYGWNNTVRWKDLDITIFLRGVIGNKLLNVTRWQYTPDGTADIKDNVFLKDLKSGNGATKNGGAVFADHQHFSDYWLEDGSYLKCDNITVGYTFRFKENKYIRTLKLTATGQNLFTVTGYSGLDPEVSTMGVGGAGIDGVNFYPKTASFLIGLNLNLL